MPRDSHFDMQNVIDALSGTCDSLDDALQEFNMTIDDLVIDDYNRLDNEIFKCTTCDWWYELCEQATDEGVCDNCNE